ncbi:hypothetical protein OH407_23960, partial [Salmonella enterica]|uniref:hypothetical protein n=1 Tax=Salmonella enterica TaxID=28901 RepID=UPI0022B6E7BA
MALSGAQDATLSPHSDITKMADAVSLPGARPPRPRYMAYDRGPMPVAAMAADYQPGHLTTRHRHP